MNRGSRQDGAPRVSVILPVYNAAPFIGEAVESILGQTLGDFEVIAIDDGSTDDSLARLRAAAGEDARVHVMTRGNRGLVATLNEAIGAARGEFLARMDADDVALPARFEKQVAYLHAHRDVAVVGSWIETFGMEERRWEHPRDPEAVACALVFRCPLAHPSVMMRRGLFVGGTRPALAYDPQARHLEDYALWMAVAERHRLANIPEVLLRYRTHAAQVCAVHAGEQREMAAALQLTFIARRLHLVATPAEAAVHRALAFDQLEASQKFARAAELWLLKLAEANERRGAFPRRAFLQVLTGRWVAVARMAAANALSMGAVSQTPFAGLVRDGAITPAGEARG